MNRRRLKLNRRNCLSCKVKLDGANKTYCKKCFLYKFGRRSKYRKKVLERDKEYQRNKRANNPDYKTKESREYRKKHPKEWRAQQKLNYYLKLGKIKKSFCEVCGASKRVHGHHPNYDRPLEVIWLCPIHHKEIHKIKI